MHCGLRCLNWACTPVYFLDNCFVVAMEAPDCVGAKCEGTSKRTQLTFGRTKCV